MYKIIMPAYNAEERIFNTLCGNLQHRGEIIVVDDGSSDGTCSEIKRFNDAYSTDIGLCRLEKNGKKIGAIRKGVQMITENMSGIEKVILMDDDTILASQPKNIESACSRMDNGGYAAVSFRMVPKNTSSFIEKCRLWNIMPQKQSNGF